MMRIEISAVIVALASGCALSTDNDDDAVETSSISSAVTVLPEQGFWFYEESAPISTTCNARVPRPRSGTFFLDQLTATSYRVFPSDGLPPFTCTITDNRFNCPTRATIEIDVFGLDADLTLQIHASGVHTDARHGVGKQDVAVTCSGSQCNQIGPMPCGYVHNFTDHEI
jgi:hypothetical protein